ncbi:MAG: hotdog fold thioesterase [Myxococcota bacterium]|nr:hotdog fold thioesterase [Myxococcota bacterium]
MTERSDQPEHLRAVHTFMEAGIPFNRVLGLKVDSIKPGFASLRMPFRDELIGDVSRPALHGGTLSALADAAGGAALFSTADPDTLISTIDLRIDYLRPGKAAEVFADASVVRLGNRVGVARIVLWQHEAGEELLDAGQDKKVIAEATGVYSVRSTKPDS